MHMTLQEQIRANLTVAMKAKKEPELTVLRGLLSMFTQELTSTKRTPQDMLSDDEALAVIRRAVKQRADAAQQFRSGNREDLAQAEDAEAVILKAYLPQLMSRDEILPIVRAKMTELAIQDKSKVGVLVGSVLKELKGKADGADVKSVAEELLG
jgi:uncharacterized protein YqeY